MIEISKEKCIACGLCIKDCPVQNIAIEAGTAKVLSDTCILCGHCIAVCPQNAVTMDDYPMDDVKAYNKADFEIESNQLLNFIKFRRTVRQFKNKPVEEEKILNMIEAGRYTPTGGNRQDVSYIVVRDRIPQLRSLALEKLYETALQQANQSQIYAGLTQKWEAMLEAEREQPGKMDELFFHAPVLLLLIGKEGFIPGIPFAASNMELMATTQGIGVMHCGFFLMAAHKNEKIKAVLGLNDTQEVTGCLVLGYPDVTYQRTVPRKPAVIDWI